MRREEIEGIPVILAEPDEVRGGPVLWMSHLGGSAEKEVPMLERLAEAGRPAISFDAPEHGSRAEGDPREFAQSVLASYRRRMWPLLGLATLEALRVLDWACETVDPRVVVVVGGVSMGGDVAVALAGIEPRIRRVAAVGSTPDWSRPEMHGFGGDAPLIDQGEADSYARWFAEQLDPMRHLDRYLSGPSISFELGGADRHIPASDAERFDAALAALDPGGVSPVRIRTHPGLDHFGVTTDEAALDSAVHQLLGEDPKGRVARPRAEARLQPRGR